MLHIQEKLGGGVWLAVRGFHRQNWHDTGTYTHQMQQNLGSRDRLHIICQRRGHDNAEGWLYSNAVSVKPPSSAALAPGITSIFTCITLTSAVRTMMTGCPDSYLLLLLLAWIECLGFEQRIFWKTRFLWLPFHQILIKIIGTALWGYGYGSHFLTNINTSHIFLGVLNKIFFENPSCNEIH